MSATSGCHFAVLARIPSDEHHQQQTGFQHHGISTTAAMESSADDDAYRLVSGDLIVALSSLYLHVFARKIKNLGCSCRQNPNDKLLASGLHCPHIIGYDDYCYIAAVPLRSIVQVLITYRTALVSSSTQTLAIQGSSVAARTKDLILKLNNDAYVWLEFEHNLARGVFLDVLTSSAVALTPNQRRAAADIDVDYVDLSELSGFSIAKSMHTLTMFPALENLLEEREPGSPKKKRSPSTMIQELFLPVDTEGDERDARFVFVRDALRHVAHDKVHLALQIAREQLAEDTACGLLLNTAMEISQALDEPDLSAFTWLASAFINMQAGARDLDKHKLALTQATHSAKLARENGFPYLLSLALHCAADLQFRGEKYVAAKDLLVEAARLTPDAVELGMKMQLHRKIHDLRECTKVTRTHSTSIRQGQSVSSAHTTVSVLSNGFAISKKAQNAFSLWDHSVSVQFKGLLLHKVFKLPSPGMASSHSIEAASQSTCHKRSGSCYVEVVERQQSARSITGTQKLSRLRVFFDSRQTLEWLRSEVLGRIRTTRCEDPSTVREIIEGFWDREDFQQQSLRLDWSKRLGDVVTTENQLLVAQLVAVESSVPQNDSSGRRGGSPAKVQPAADGGQSFQQQMTPELPMITCSVCHARIPLDDVESHSETCC
ncbi:hypothetical protein Gpo141_00012770 [Globisporangium polare]